MLSEREHRKQMIAASHRIYQRGYVASNDGNLAIKLGEDRFLVTPSGFSKGDLTESDLLICDSKGRKVAGKHKVTSEIFMHLRAFNLRSDIQATVHAHPVFATAFSLSSVSLAECLLPEVILSFGSIPTSGYAQPASKKGADIIKDLINDYDVILIDRHGSFTAGKDVWDAYYKLERLEHVAQITYYARQLGPVKNIPRDEMERLIERGVKEGINPVTLSACALNSNGSCSGNTKTGTPGNSSDIPDRALITSIVREVLQSL